MEDFELAAEGICQREGISFTQTMNQSQLKAFKKLRQSGICIQFASNIEIDDKIEIG